ncbi:phage tail protein [Vibrio sp. S17_S38]|uniref:phage tail protein n=1 Tax=Vibrio sp. S17_S38 TaxID=2720229 RepID=UPI001680226C|nr:phage tail protein [Vibrio sp. S17_S38]MBD1572471.1 phage tail protein [Vibrio sp. S17_S38]
MADEPLKTAVLTDIGITKLDDAYQAGTKITIAEMALGDANFEYVTPDPAFTQLVNEFGRQPINEGNTSDTWINAIVYVDSMQFAGKSILEFGLYDNEGDLIVYSSYTPSVIPDVGQDYIQLEIECSVDLYNASVVTIDVTPIYPQATELERGIAKIITEEQVDAGIDDSAFLTIKKFTRALSASYVINTLVEKLWLGIAKRICPVGVPLPWGSDIAPDGFAIHKGQAFDILANPELAKLYPDGIIPDMRGLGIIGKEDGELILAYEEGQVKEHGHPNSTVSSTNLGTKTTSTQSLKANIELSRAYDSGYADQLDYIGRGQNLGRYWKSPTSKISIPNHAHTVAIGSHAHSVAIALFGALKNTINHRKFNWIVRLA